MPLITNNEILDYLTIKNIPTTDLTDADLTLQYNTYLNYILTTTGVNINSETKTIHDVLINKFKNRNYLLTDYPITEITNITIDNQTIQPNQYYLDLENGIIRWKSPPTGEFLTITYTTQPSTELLALIGATILDMIYYGLDNSPTKDITSLREGDVSISFDTDNSTGNTINKNLDKIKDYANYQGIGRMIR